MPLIVYSIGFLIGLLFKYRPRLRDRSRIDFRPVDLFGALASFHFFFNIDRKHSSSPNSKIPLLRELKALDLNPEQPEPQSDTRLPRTNNTGTTDGLAPTE